MNKDGSGDDMPQGSAERGLWRLMLKLPALRGQLQLLNRKTATLSSLCEAYEDASVTLQRLRANPGDAGSAMRDEYETICTEIETEVISYCIAHRTNVPD